MADNPNQPKEDDAVLGGQNLVPSGGVILGGVEGTKQRLASADIEQRIAALKEAMKYGREGLDLVIQALKDKSGDVQHAAYLMLRAKGELEVVKQALREYNPYQRLECIYTLKTRASSHLTFSPNGQFFATSLSQEIDSNPYVHLGDECFIELWDVRTGQRIDGEHMGGRIHSLAFSSVNQCLIVGKSSGVSVWNRSVSRWYYSSEHSGIWSVAVSPDGYTFASGSSAQTIKLWNLLDVFNTPSRQPMRSRCTLKENSEPVEFLAFSPDGQTLISCGDKSEIKLWNVSTGKSLHSFEQNVIEPNPFTSRHTVVSFSPDNRVLAAAYDATTHSIKVWNLFTGELLHNFAVVSCGDIAFSPDSRTLASTAATATSEEMQVSLWDLETGKLLCTLSHSNRPYRVVFSPDGKTLATTSSPHLVKLWRIQGID